MLDRRVPLHRPFRQQWRLLALTAATTIACRSSTAQRIPRERTIPSSETPAASNAASNAMSIAPTPSAPIRERLSTCRPTSTCLGPAACDLVPLECSALLRVFDQVLLPESALVEPTTGALAAVTAQGALTMVTMQADGFSRPATVRATPAIAELVALLPDRGHTVALGVARGAPSGAVGLWWIRCSDGRCTQQSFYAFRSRDEVARHASTLEPPVQAGVEAWFDHQERLKKQRRCMSPSSTYDRACVATMPATVSRPFAR